MKRKTPGWPFPIFVGCVRCGQEFGPAQAAYEQCAACGKTCGVCRPCARILGWHFTRDAMAWHRQRHHPDLTLPAAERQRLLHPDGEHRRWGEKLVL